MTNMIPPWREQGVPPIAQPRARISASAANSELDNPATSAERLQQIAADHPELCVRIAAHPNCYPALQEWIVTYSPPISTPAASVAGSKSRKAMKAFAIAAGIALPLITATSITLPIIANLAETTSSTDTLKIVSAPSSLQSAEVIGEETTKRYETRNPTDYQLDWRLPVDAPIETFPLELSYSSEYGWYQCSELQLAWLTEHAEPYSIMAAERTFEVTVHNSASTGASLPLGNIRFEGEEVEATPWLYFGCPGGGRGATNGAQLLLIGIGGEEAVYGEALTAAGDDVMPEGSPVTLNLEPGEVSALTLTRDPDVDALRRYEGRFIADVMDGSGETVILAENVTFRHEQVPMYKVSIDAVSQSPTFQMLICSTADPDSQNQHGLYDRWEALPCHPAQAIAHLKRAERSVSSK